MDESEIDGPLGLEELRNLASTGDLNLDVAKEAHAQVEKRLNDHLDVRKIIDAKATLLYGSFVTVSLATFGVGGALLKEAAWRAVAWPFLVSGLLFVSAAAMAIYATRSRLYAFSGSAPDFWLRPGTINGGDQALAYALARLVHHHELRIVGSMKSNRRKRRSVLLAQILGLIGAIALAGGLVIAVPWSALVAHHP